MATLFVVATPIGNLEDLTPRAARVLSECPVVAAESVNRTRKLLSHLGLKGKTLISCREANRRRAAAQVLAALESGRDVALVSDAGTPGLSDPGGLVVSEAIRAGRRVSPIPGPSALAAAVSVSGLAAAPILFLGFLPAKAGARRRLLERARDSGWPLVMYEAPHRLAAAAADLAEIMGERPAVLARELTKLNEQVVHAACRELPALARECARGEITLLVAGDEEAAGPRVDLDSLLLEEMARGRVSPSRLAQQAAAASGETRERVYRRIMELKNRDQDRPPKARALNTMNPESDQSFLERELPVQNALGLHARAAARILETVRNYDCRIIFSKDGLEADADSILSLLTLDAPLGSTLLARAQGPQADQALQALGRLFANCFGEDA